MSFQREKWLLTIELDTLEAQYERDPENVFPNAEAERIIAIVTKHWSLLPEDLEECCKWTDTKVELTGDVMDYFVELLPEIMMRTVPLRIELTRV
jgi:hypothetical protein